jgi:hypothetical protein
MGTPATNVIADPARFAAAIERFDAVNAEDPNTEQAEGRAWPRELLYARRMTERLERFAPDAPEVVRLAARAQHIARWKIPRDAYPMDRVGYLTWRTELAKLHARIAGDILRDVGHDGAAVDRVQALLRKRRLKQDPEAQLLEDVICMVFLEHYLADFAAKHEEAKVIDIIAKTWAKMSAAGQAAAARLDLSPAGRGLVEKALAGS